MVKKQSEQQLLFETRCSEKNSSGCFQIKKNVFYSVHHKRASATIFSFLQEAKGLYEMFQTRNKINKLLGRHHVTVAVETM